MDRIEMMKRHLGRAIEFEIETRGTKDIFRLPPLPMEKLPELFALISKLEKHKPNYAEAIDNDFIKISSELIKYSLKQEYPEIDDNLLNEFVSNNFMVLLMKFTEINSSVMPSDIDILQLKK